MTDKIKNTSILSFTIMLAALTAIQPMSTDMYLPSLLEIVDDFATDVGMVQLTLSLFMLGFAIGQIIYGPFADKYGRRPVLFVGLAIYLAATLLCIFATNIETLIAARFIQALGGAGPLILGRTIVRDLLKGDQAAKLLATIGFIMGLMPMIAPIFGGFLATYFTWHSNFYFFFFYGVVLVLMVMFLLPETNPKKTTHKLTPITFVKIYNGLFSSKIFRFFVTRMSLNYGGIFVFISGSSYYIQTRFELSPLLYSYVFAFSVLGYLVGTLLGSRIVIRFGAYKVIYFGAIFQLLGGVSMFLLHLAPAYHALQLGIPMFLYLVGAGLSLPNSMAGSMSDFPEKAGAASSLAGFVQVTTAASIGTMVGFLIEDYIYIMPLTLMALGLINFFPCFTHRNDKLTH